MKLYHVTATERVESIRRNGLTADLTGASDPAHTDAGVWLFASMDSEESEGTTYVHRHGTDNYSGDLEYAVVVIDAEGCDLIPDPEYPEGVSMICLHDIDPERIVDIITVDLYE